MEVCSLCCAPGPMLVLQFTNRADAVARATHIIKSQQGRQRVPKPRLPRGRRAVTTLKK